MSAKNKQDLKQEFLSGSKITQAKLESLIDSSVNKVDDLSIDANGNVGIGTTSPSAKLHIEGENPEFLIKGTSDSNNATLNIYGSVQGTGRVYVGQSSIFGGGIEYNGDGSPGTTDAGKDYITLWRRNGYEDEGERDHWTARNQYNSNDWEFRGKLKATEFEGDGSKLTNLSVGLNGLNLATESGNVGIGTTSPSAKLDVSGNIKSTGTDFFLDNESRRNNEGGSYRRALVHNNNDVLTINYGSDYTGGVNIQGNVGIGTSIPNNKLDVRGQLGVNTTGGDNNWIQWWTDDDDDHPAHIWSSNRRMRFGTWDGWTNKSSWSEKVCITGNGNVGIGITNPSAKLEVAGNTSLGGTLAVTGATTLNSDLTVTGNFTVNGTTTTIDSQNHVVNDSLMELGNGTAGAPINDSGIIIERGTSENVFIGWVESANKFTVGATTATGASSGDLSITKGTLVANIEGNITGEVQTAAQPNITSLGTLNSLNVTGATKLSDTLTVSGTGDHSFAGNVGIGTTSVSSGVKLDVAGIARFKGTNLDIELGTPGGNTGVIFNRSEESNFQRFDIYNRPSDNYFTLCYNNDGSNSNGLYIKQGGNVGIGTTSPSAKLEVAGTIKVPYKESTANASISIGDDTFHDGNIYALRFGESETNELGMGTYTSTQRVFSDSSNGLGIHVHSDAEFSVKSSGWTNLFGIRGGTGNAYFKGSVGIGTTDPDVKLQIGSSIVHDASRTYDENALKIIHPTATSNTAINDPMPILYLGRDGTSGVAYGALATFKLCRFEESSLKSKTRLDIDLTDDYFVDQNVMTLLANGSVGIGTTSPGAKLEVSGDIKCTNLTIEESIQSPLFDAHTIFEEVSYDTDSWKSQISINFPAGSKLIHHIHVSNHTASGDSNLHSWEIKKGTGAYTQWKTIKQFFNSDADHQHRSATFIETITSNTTINRWQIDTTSTPDVNDFISWVIQVVPNGQGT